MEAHCRRLTPGPGYLEAYAIARVSFRVYANVDQAHQAEFDVHSDSDRAVSDLRPSTARLD